MADPKEIDLLNLLMPPATRGEQLIFEDEHFKRQTLHIKLDPAIEADIIIDFLDAESSSPSKSGSQVCSK